MGKIANKEKISKAPLGPPVPVRTGDGSVRAGIIGGAGYTGGELMRLLIHHPGTAVSFVHSRSNAGNPVHNVHQDLIGETD